LSLVAEIPPRSYLSRIRFKLSGDAQALAIGLPTRKTSPIEFGISLLQMLPPLNVKMHYIIQKAADCAVTKTVGSAAEALREMIAAEGSTDEVCHGCNGLGRISVVERGVLGAKARNAILQSAIESNTPYVVLLDDDVLFPDMAIYRLWVAMQRHPEAGAITGIYCTKADPTEPLIYVDEGSGAYWDWPLGAILPIHSAGAGIQIVNMAAVKQLAPPWFNDVISDEGAGPDGLVRRHTWGHDRYFHIRLREEAKAPVYVDTGLICAHWDTDHQRAYILPPDSPCFQLKDNPPVGESFVPFLEANGAINWTRLLAPLVGNPEWARFRNYLDWVNTQSGTDPNVGDRQVMVPA
jgi:hypothetical protein